MKTINEESSFFPSIYKFHRHSSVSHDQNSINKKREIIYIRYDDVNMKYVYMCSECSVIWKTNNV